MKALISSLRTVFASTSYRIVGVVSALILFAVNLFALSTPVGNGAFASSALHYVNATVIFRSVLMAILLGILTPFSVYLLRQRAGAHLGASSAGLLCSGIFCLLGPLCCGAITLVVGWLAALTPATASLGTHLYTFLGSHESLFFYLSVLLLAYALYMNSRKIASLVNHGCPTSSPA